MNVTEEDVRQSLREFADTAAPADPRPAALARAKRMRVRRTAAAVATGAALTALAVLMINAIRPPTPTAPPVMTQSETPFEPTLSTLVKRVDLVDGWYFAAGPTAQGARVWNPATATYDLYAGKQAWPSPDGTSVAVAGDDGLTIRSTGRPDFPLVKGRALVGSPQWSAAGDRLLFGEDLADGDSVQYRVADLVHRTVVPVPNLGCGKNCVLVWLPGFSRVANLNDDDTMTVYDLRSGRQIAVLPFTARSALAWSDDGNQVVTQSALLDAQTGRRLCTLSFGNASVVHWIDAHTFIMVNETVHIVGDTCREQAHRWLPGNWLMTEPSQYILNHE